jgi:hypothetical protein
MTIGANLLSARGCNLPEELAKRFAQLLPSRTDAISSAEA